MLTFYRFLYRLLPFVLLASCEAFQERLQAAGTKAAEGLPKLAENPSAGGLIEYLLPILVTLLVGGPAAYGAVRVKRALKKPSI